MNHPKAASLRNKGIEAVSGLLLRNQ